MAIAKTICPVCKNSVTFSVRDKANGSTLFIHEGGVQHTQTNEVVVNEVSTTN